MGKFKKLGIILTSTAFSVGVLSPMAQASANVKDSPERIEIQVASTETKVTKSTLIKKLRELFPEKFNFLTDNDFYTGRGHYYNDDKTIRYELSFHKTVNGKDIYGGITFRGDDLELEQFYYQPANVADALYPAKYSKEEAQKIAQDFLNKFPNTAGYKLQDNENDYDYYGYNFTRPLSEPISYSFSYAPTQNGVTISDHYMSINVLANGEIVNVYHSSDVSKKATFDSTEQKKSEADVLAQIRENFNVELRYYVNYDYQTEKPTVKLVYVPTSSFYGVHALTGNWQTANGFVQTPRAKSVEKLSSEQLAPRKSGMTLEEVEEFAKSFLKVNSENVKLHIDMIDERETENGETLYSVNYSYQYENGSYGSSFEINKATGEITQYYDISRDFTAAEKKSEKITKDAALNKAIDYLKEWAPSYIHNYAKPLDDYRYEESNQYSFSFPRVVNGIAVAGDEIYVSIGTDGSLRSLSINQQKIDNWPSVSKVVAADQVKETFSEALKVKLQYVKQDKEDSHHYDLVYTPTYEGSIFNQIDATTGKWVNSEEDANKAQISHPTAANELNYLLAQNVLEVKDPANFNADTSVTKGEALKILLKSLTYGYFGSYGEEEEAYQSFTNIDPKHPLYGVVEQAVRMGVLQPADEFAVDAKLTRQELAEWYIRVLRLESAAKHSDIYKLNFADAGSIDPAYAGYVALVSAMGLMDAQQNNFNATADVSYADLAVSTIRLARAIHENNTSRNYY